MGFNAQQVIIPVLRQVTSRPRLANLLFSRDRWGNLLGDERYSNPFPMLEQIRAEGNVVGRREYRAWFVVGYDEVKYLLTHDAAEVEPLLQMVDNVRPYSKMAPETAAFFPRWMLSKDEPDHGRIRRLASRAFTPKRIAGWEPMVEEIATDLLRPLAERDQIDVVSEFAVRLPIQVILRVLGIPLEREAWMREMATEMGLYLAPFEQWDYRRVDRAVTEFSAYVGELADERSRDPRDDLFSALVAVESEEDGRLSREELVSNVALLAFAGFETTAGALGNSILALYRNPDQRQLVVDDPSLWPNAVEELLRYDPPVTSVTRVFDEDVEVDGQVIPSGQVVSLLLQVANRDPRRYDRPNELLLDRADPQPISFGHGIHYCLGSHLARQELRIGLRTFLETFGPYTVDESAIEWRRSTILRGPLAMKVRPAAG